MQVLKVTLEGLTTSFRYPHLMQEAQPSYPMPPPATIYGHICSALGEWVDPTGIKFAYHFTSQGGVTDYEHIHVLSASSGKLPSTNLPKVQEGNVNLFKRELLFQPRLTLYLNRPEWYEAFRAPYYPVVLGRSQDLCSYTQIELVTLETQPTAYLEHTLLPYAMAPQIERGVVVLMPRLLDYARNRTPTFARYVMLQRRIRTGELFSFGNTASTSYLVDPTAPRYDGLARAIIWQTFAEE